MFLTTILASWWDHLNLKIMPNAHACLDFSCRNNSSRHLRFLIRIPIAILKSFLKNSVRIPQSPAKKSLELSADKMTSNAVGSVKSLKWSRILIGKEDGYAYCLGTLFLFLTHIFNKHVMTSKFRSAGLAVDLTVDRKCVISLGTCANILRRTCA